MLEAFKEVGREEGVDQALANTWGSEISPNQG
jgi:hypothetical protein